MKWLTECWSFQAMIISPQAPAKKFVVLVDAAAQSLRIEREPNSLYEQNRCVA
jgi:hypothetical protein